MNPSRGRKRIPWNFDKNRIEVQLCGKIQLFVFVEAFTHHGCNAIFSREIYLVLSLIIGSLLTSIVLLHRKTAN